MIDLGLGKKRHHLLPWPHVFYNGLWVHICQQWLMLLLLLLGPDGF
jgi:hypothetical protein